MAGLIDAVGLRDVDQLRGVLSNLTKATKRIGVSQENEHSWFILWTNDPDFEYEDGTAAWSGMRGRSAAATSGSCSLAHPGPKERVD